MDLSDNPHDGGEDAHGKRYLTMKIFERGCPELQELDALRKQGWEDDTLKESLDKRNAKAREATDQSSAKKDADWFRASKRVMAALIKETKFLDAGTKVDRFLDLGCCPGGFSECILQNCRPEPRGVGVSLKVKDGGYGLKIRPPNPRFKMYWGDLTYFNICAPASASVVDKPRISRTPPKCRREFQLAILDGHHRRPQESENTHKWDIDRLLVAQLIIALESLAVGGILIITLKRVELPTTARILYMLDKLSNTIDALKPSGSHKTDSMFYAVAQGVGLGQEGPKRDFYVRHLKNLWWELTFGGPSGKGRWIHQPDLDFIVDTQTLAETYLDRLMDLGKRPWSTQRDGLKDVFEKEKKNREQWAAKRVAKELNSSHR